MSRQKFGLWGVELSDDDFACALVARGLLVNGLEGELKFRGGPGTGVMLWRLREPLDPPSSAISPMELAQAWKRSGGIRRGRTGNRLSVHGNARGAISGLDPVWLNGFLTGPATNVDGIVWERLNSRDSVSPFPPFGIGFFSDADSRHLREQMGASTSNHKIVDATDPQANCDILLVPYGLRRTLGEVLTYPRMARVGAILVLEYTEPTKDSLAFVDMLLEQTPASVVALVSISALPPHLQRAWLKHVLDQLESLETLDVALFLAARAQTLPAPFVISRPSALPLPVTRSLSIKNSKDTPFDYLGVFAENHAIESIAPVEVPSPRMLQARMYDCSESRHGQLVEKALRARRPHRIDVRIAGRDHDWLAANEVFPKQKLGPGPHALTIVFTEPRLSPTPQVAKFILHEDERKVSQPCAFFLHTGDSPGELDARISVLHRNRILQTARLHASIVDDTFEDEHATISPISLTIEAVVRQSLEGLSSRKPFDATLLFNHDAQNAPRVTKFVGERASLVRLGEIGDVVKRIGQRLAQIALEPKDFEGLEAVGTVDLLRELAHDGALLYAGIFVDGGVDPALIGAKRLQVISAHADAIVPIEFCYDRPAPALDAPLCPGAKDALRTGKCGAACPIDPSTVVCPLGFWGLSKVIERHAHDPAYARQLQWSDYAFQAEPTAWRDRLAPLAAAVGAAADKASTVEPKLVERLFGKLDALTSGHGQKVSTWADWKSAIAQQSPSLLVLLAHTETLDNKITVLEIGNADWLPQANVRREHVRSPSGGPPIVLLMGCKTALEDASFLNFIMPFRQKGAAIVVATLANVLGRHAAPTTEALLTAMAEVPQGGGATLGDVLLQVRRRLVAAGMPMSLTLVAFGDADWRIDPKLS